MAKKGTGKLKKTYSSYFGERHGLPLPKKIVINLKYQENSWHIDSEMRLFFA